MGEYDLMRLAFLLDLGLYYLGIVSQPFKMGIKGLQAPPFSEPLSRPVFPLMRTYNRRFAQIARRRRRLDLLGKTNRAQRCLANGFTLSRSDIRLIFKTIFRWALAGSEGRMGEWGRREVSVSVSVPEEKSSRLGKCQLQCQCQGEKTRTLMVPHSKDQGTGEVTVSVGKK